METLAGQIKKNNAIYVSDAQKLRSEFDLAIKKIRVRKFKNTNCHYHIICFITNFRLMKISKQLK